MPLSRPQPLSDGLAPPGAFLRGMVVLDLEQSLDDARAVYDALEQQLALADPAAAWCPEEAWRRAQGGRN